MIFDAQREFSVINYAVVGLFLVGILLVGVLSRSRETSTSGFLLGGRRMPWLAVTISMVMALFSAISFVAVPGEAYGNGLRMSLVTVMGMLLIPFSIWMFLRFYYTLGSFTPYEYLERRFSPSARLMAGILFLATRGFYLAVVLYASAKAFEGAFGWEAWFTILMMGGLGAFYTVIGGVKSVIWADVIQFFILFGGILAAAIMLTINVRGGFTGVFSYAFEHRRGFNFDWSFFSANPYERVTFWWILLMALGQTLSYYATDQITIQKLLSTKTYADAKRAAYSKIPVILSLTAVFWYVGLALFVYYSQVEPEQGQRLTGDKAFAYYVTTRLPTPLPGLVMASLLAATITTITSGTSSLSTVAIKDVYVRFFDQGMNDHTQMRLSQKLIGVTTVFTILVAMAINWVSDRAGLTVLEVASIWQSLGGMVLGMFILGVSSCRVGNKLLLIATATATIMLMLAVIFLYYRQEPSNRISFILVGNVGLLATLAVGYCGSFFCKILPAEQIEGLTLLTLNNLSR